jgi:hypothetical protein
MIGLDSRLGVGAVMVLLLGTSAYSVSGLVRERRRVQDLTASNEALLASSRQLQDQVRSVSEKLSTMSATASQPPAAPPPSPFVLERPAARAVPSSSSKRVSRSPKSTRAAEDPRWRQMQAKLTDQQKALEATQQRIDATREEASQARKELQNNLASTRDELGGSIARTHDQLVALEKRGERNYYEFQIDKSKQFHSEGPLRLSVRKVNVKQGYYDLVLEVDDRQLEKKHVNLFEPLMFTLADRPQPVELVVNQISKDQVKGYVSEPKYKKSDLATASPSAPANDPKGLQRR